MYILTANGQLGTGWEERAFDLELQWVVLGVNMNLAKSC